MEQEVNKYVKAKGVASTQAFLALFGVFMETPKVCVTLNIDDDDDDGDDDDDQLLLADQFASTFGFSK